MAEEQAKQQRTFTEAAFLEAAIVTKQITNSLHERTTVQGVTIDDPRAKDLDDAFWLERMSEGYKLLVSITDVASFIDPHLTPTLEKEACERSFTLYFADETSSPMLPTLLSEDHLSLLEEQPRPALTVSLLLDAQMNPGEIQISRTCVRNRRRLSMSEADEAIEHPKDEIDSMLQLAYTLAQRLLERRKLKGALALYDVVTGWATTEEGRLRPLGEGERYCSSILTQEFMVLTNQSCAMFLAEQGTPALYRNHQARMVAPERSILGQMIEMAVAHPELSNPERVRATVDLAMERATYAPMVIGHFGLNLSVYMHLTSPLRRYADLVNQRILLAVLKGEDFPYTKLQLEEIAAFLNEKEREMKAARPAHFLSEYDHALLTRIGESENTSMALADLDTKKFHSLIRMACERNMLSAAVEQEVMRRLEQQQLKVHDIFTLLFRFKNSGDQWHRVKAAALRALQQQPYLAVSLLQMGKQTLGWGEPSYEESFEGADHLRAFSALVKVRVGEQPYVSSRHMAHQKVFARQLACVEVVVRIAGIDPSQF